MILKSISKSTQMRTAQWGSSYKSLKFETCDYE
jgi:hypothetical protein